ncbi:MAG: hypothetical protein HY906_08890 [Deltaproteobacteria bacterium]|nr:hypothetical protein [Deltaproteobacteria bacterium]
MLPPTLVCAVCGGPVAGAPVVLCPGCRVAVHSVCAVQRGACPGCGARLPGLVPGAPLPEALAPPVPPPAALICPRCAAPAQPAAEVQRCSSCGGAFTLRAGALLDPTVRPPPVDPRAPRLKSRSASAFTYRIAAVEAHGVVEGMADPVTGAIPLEQTGVAWGDVFTVAVWRRLDIAQLVLALLFPVPVTLLSLWGVVTATPWWLLSALPFGLLAGIMLYRAFGVQVNRARVAGRHRTVTVRFDRPLWRRRRFHDELLRRAGIAAGPIP